MKFVDMRIQRHAYLIMAHKVDHVLMTLLKMIDNNYNDVYIHFDLKSKGNLNVLKGVLEHSPLVFVKRVKVYWGHISQCHAMYTLWEEAYERGPYNYYHLISGVDLPIQRQSEIRRFFAVNSGRNFVGFSPNKLPEKYNYHYFHPKYRGAVLLQSLLHRFEKAIGMKNKLFTKYMLQRGCQWSSLTNEAVSILLGHKKEFLSALRYANCPDEIITQTILYNSKLKDSIYDMNDEFRSCMRLIDWNRGTPYTYTLDDFKEINTSDRIFCRKISDSALADKIYEIYGDDRGTRE